MNSPPHVFLLKIRLFKPSTSPSAKDDVVNFADAAAELGVPPMSAAQVVACTLEAAGNENLGHASSAILCRHLLCQAHIGIYGLGYIFVFKLFNRNILRCRITSGGAFLVLYIQFSKI